MAHYDNRNYSDRTYASGNYGDSGHANGNYGRPKGGPPAEEPKRNNHVTYNNPNGVYPNLDPSFFPINIPGISLPPDFALEAADRTLDPSVETGVAPNEDDLPPATGPARFPIRRGADDSFHGKAIARMIGAFSGPGFNLIFRPNTVGEEKRQEGKDLLELNLTHELWKFPAKEVTLGKVPNRVAVSGEEEDVNLRGIPYTQIVRDVTCTESGREGRVQVDRLGNAIDDSDKKLVNDIHFECGLFMNVPKSPGVLNEATITRMASIPHGTTINAQGAAAKKITDGKKPKIPNVSPLPFGVDNSGPLDVFREFEMENEDTTRLPKILMPFKDVPENESAFQQDLINNPNLLLIKHNNGKVFSEVIEFTVSTAPLQALEKQACPHLVARDAMNTTNDALRDIEQQIEATDNPDVREQLEKAKSAIKTALEAVSESVAALPTSEDPSQIAMTMSRATAPAIGSANIAMLDGAHGSDGGMPNARTGRVESTFWISTVVYTIDVPQNMETGTVLEPEATSDFFKGTVPTFTFPPDKEVAPGMYQVEATQIQYSQTVNLIFNTLVWPHISVATVVPIRPILVRHAVKVE